MRIQYLGPLSAIQLASGTVLPRGESIQVPDEVGKRLIAERPEQFKEVGRKPKGGDR